MTNITRKGIWTIVITTLVVALVIFFAWATSGFTNWNAESWFDYWGKGKPVKTDTVSKDKDSKAMVMTSADVDHEVVTDSPDASTTFAVSTLKTPTFSAGTNTSVFCVALSGHNGIVGTINVYAFSGRSNSSGTLIFSFSFDELKSVGFLRRVTFSEFSEKIKTLSSTSVDSETGTHIYGIYAQHVGYAGYLDSPISSTIYVSDIPEITSDFSGSTYKVSCLEPFYKTGAFQLSVLKSPSSTAVPFLVLQDVSYVTYKNGYIEVDLLTLSNELQKLDILDLYYFYFCYKAFNSDSFSLSYFSSIPCISNSFIVTHLSAPANLKYDSGTITWDPVEGANEYGVFWTQGGVEQKAFVSTTSYTFDINALGVGNHTVRVRALGNLGQTAKARGLSSQINAFNASRIVQQVVALTYKIEGDTLTKFVPYGSNVKDYLYDVEIKGREFGGWYYDSGFSRKVEANDVLAGDTTVYARLSENKVTERKLTWWEQHKWQVLIPIFVVGGLVILGSVVAVIRKRKA